MHHISEAHRTVKEIIKIMRHQSRVSSHLQKLRNQITKLITNYIIF